MTSFESQSVSPLCARLVHRGEGAEVTFRALLTRRVAGGLRDSALLSRIGTRESGVHRLFSRVGGERNYSGTFGYRGGRALSNDGFSWISMPAAQETVAEEVTSQRRSWWSAPKRKSSSSIRRVANRAVNRGPATRSIFPSAMRASVGLSRSVAMENISLDAAPNTPTVMTDSNQSRQAISPSITVSSPLSQRAQRSAVGVPSPVRVAVSRSEIGRVSPRTRSQIPTVTPSVLAFSARSTNPTLATGLSASPADVGLDRALSTPDFVSPTEVAAARSGLGQSGRGSRSQLPTISPAMLASSTSSSPPDTGAALIATPPSQPTSLSTASARTVSPVSVAASRFEIGRVSPRNRSQLPTVTPSVLALPAVSPPPATEGVSLPTETVTALSAVPTIAVSRTASPVSVAASRSEVGRVAPSSRSQLPAVTPSVLAFSEVVAVPASTIVPSSPTLADTATTKQVTPAMGGGVSRATSPVSVAVSRSEVGRVSTRSRSQLPTVTPSVLASPASTASASDLPNETASQLPVVQRSTDAGSSPVNVAASRSEVGRVSTKSRSQLPTVTPSVLASPVSTQSPSDLPNETASPLPTVQRSTDAANSPVNVAASRSENGRAISGSRPALATVTPAVLAPPTQESGLPAQTGVDAPAASPVSVAASRSEIGRSLRGSRSQLPTITPSVLAPPIQESSLPAQTGVVAPTVSPVGVAASRSEIGRSAGDSRSQLPKMTSSVFATTASSMGSTAFEQAGGMMTPRAADKTPISRRAVSEAKPSQVGVAVSRFNMGDVSPGRRSQLPRVTPSVLASSPGEREAFVAQPPVAHALSREHLGLQSASGTSMLPVVTPRFGMLRASEGKTTGASTTVSTNGSGWAKPVAPKETQTAAERSIKRRRVRSQMGIQGELVRATTTEAVVKLAAERGNAMNKLAKDLPSPTRRMVRKLVKAGVAAEAAQRKKSRARASSSWAPAHLNRSASGASMDGTDGIGRSGVMKLASKLQGLIHLAEAQNRKSEAQQAVRMAEEAATAETLGSVADAAGTGNAATIDDLRRDVLDAVMADLERLQMRSEEDPDGVELWW